MLELVPEDEVVNKYTSRGRYARNTSNVRIKEWCRRNKVTYKAYRARGKKRCFICGTADDNRRICWVEYYDYGRMICMCKQCRDEICGMIWLEE